VIIAKRRRIELFQGRYSFANFESSRKTERKFFF